MDNSISAAFAAVSRCCNRPVWVVTSACGERRSGLTATWVVPVSLDNDQPLFLLGLAATHYTTRLVVESRVAGLHLLAEDQMNLALRFGLFSGRHVDKFAGLEIAPQQTGAPILIDTLAWFDVRLLAHYDTGDRLFCWVDVAAASPPPQGEPLFERELMAQASDEQRRQMLEQLASDAQKLKPFREIWLQSLSNRP